MTSNSLYPLYSQSMGGEPCAHVTANLFDKKQGSSCLGLTQMLETLAVHFQIC